MKKTFLLPSLSVFLPAYNEALNIEEAVLQALDVLPKVAQKFEVLVVNDGSTDATLQVVKRLIRKHKHVRVVTQPNSGYGAALKRGFGEARYEWVFFTDSDLQFDIAELIKFIKFTKRHDVVIGFRKKRAEGLRRDLLAKALKFWNLLILGFPREIKDIDCAFKLIRKSSLKLIEPLFSNGAMISTELLIKLSRADFEIKQIGVHHYNRAQGKPTGNDFRVILKAILDTFALKTKLIAEDATQGWQFAQSLLFSRR